MLLNILIYNLFNFNKGTIIMSINLHLIFIYFRISLSKLSFKIQFFLF